jgi:hypothetical protein
MVEEKKQNQCGFRMKWADREIEYYGDSVLDVFNKVFEHVKSVPIMLIQPNQAATSIPVPDAGVCREQEPAALDVDEYVRISNDAKISKEEVVKIIRFEKREGFQDFVPFLPTHPDLDRDAVRLVTYAQQVGLQRTPIELSYLKKLLKGPNGYPLPGRALGLILEDFRRENVVIASQTQGRNKPFSLSEKGLKQARELLRETCKK